MILHAVPSFINVKEYGAGNWKAVEANRIALRRTGLPCNELEFDPKNPDSLVRHIPQDVRHLLLEYSWWPDLMARLKGNNPHLKIHVRTHNAEAYQHYHRAREGRKRDCVNLRLWSKFLQLAWRDIRAKWTADTLLGISEWDDEHYWKLFPGGGRVRYLPYYSPWPFLRTQVAVPPWRLRKPVMISMGGNFDPSGMANVRNYDKLAQKLSRTMSENWSHLLTWWSQWNQKVPKVSNHIEILRECLEPWDLLCQARALAVLTPFGFGFKTTVVDGLAAGCHVIVHPKIAARLPHQVRRLCIVCDPDLDNDVEMTAEILSTPPEEHDLNRQLSDKDVDIFRSLLQ
jgi:hypothetical protein